MNIKAFKILQILFVALAIVSCNPTRHEMPITTSSEEARELYIQARDLNENFDPISADSLLYLALEMDPDFALAHLLLFNKTGVNVAVQLAGQVSRGESFMIKAWKALLDRNYKLSNHLADSLLMLHPRDVHCLYFASVIARNEEKEIEFLNKAIKIDRYYAAPHLRGGICMMVLNDYEEAREHFEKYLDLTPDLGFGLNSFGHLLQNTGHEDLALVQWLRSIRLDPTYYDPYLQVVWIYYRRNEIDMVSKYTDLMYDISKTQRQKKHVLQWKANVQLIRGNLNIALDLMDQIIQVCRVDGDLRGEMFKRHYKGWFALRGNQHDLAMSIFNRNLRMAKLVDLDEGDKTRLIMRTFGCMSILYGELKDSEKAGEFLGRARELLISRNNSSESTYMNLFEGVFAFNMGNYECAKTYLSQPENKHQQACQFYLAETYRIMGQNEKAISHYRMAINKDYHIVNPYWAGLFFNKCQERLEELSH